MRIRIKKKPISIVMRRKWHFWIWIICIIAGGYGGYQFFEPVAKTSGTTYGNESDWLFHIPTDQDTVDVSPGPDMWGTKDSYHVVKLRFYDTADGKMITDQNAIDEILSMFVYTEDAFVYDEELSGNGVSCFYYNGILPAEQKAALFQGFHGKEGGIEENGKKILEIKVVEQDDSVDAEDFDGLEDALQCLENVSQGVGYHVQ